MKTSRGSSTTGGRKKGQEELTLPSQSDEGADEQSAPPSDGASEDNAVDALRPPAEQEPMQSSDNEPAAQTSENPSVAGGVQPEEASTSPAGETEPGGERLNRKRIEEQLEALKRREAELRRELAVADHPGLEDAIRALEGRAYAVTRVEAKMAQGPSKAEERRRDTVEKKLASVREKRAELDAQIAELEAELSALSARSVAFQAERQEALEQLIAALGTHEPALHAAGLEAASLVPDIGRWLPEIKTLAEKLVADRASPAPEQPN